MSNIKFISRKNIDVQAWDACIMQSVRPQIYGFSWYLDAITAGKWAALVFGDYEAVFPLPVTTKFGIPVIYQPFFCQQLGLFAPANFAETQDVFLRAIPKKFLKVHLQIRNENAVKQALRKRKNYTLALQAGYEKLYSGYTLDCKKNLRKAESVGIEMVEHHQFSAVIQLYRKSWGNLNPAVTDMHYKRFSAGCEAALAHNSLVCVQAKSGDEILGEAIFLHSPAYLHYVCAAPTDAGRKLGIMHSILDYIIHKYAGTSVVLDFEGSEIESVAAFYEKFGPELAEYWVYVRKGI